MSRLSKAATMTAIALAPLALATPAYAAPITRDGCTVTPQTPVFVGRNDFNIKVIDYPIRVTCSPNRVIRIEQRVREDDDQIIGSDRIFGSRAVSRTFAAGPSTVTVVVHGRLDLPDTESGNEEMYHDVRFRVTSGGVVGALTARTDSPNGSFAN